LSEFARETMEEEFNYDTKRLGMGNSQTLKEVEDLFRRKFFSNPFFHQPQASK
jgi:hypothetical protein